MNFKLSWLDLRDWQETSDFDKSDFHNLSRKLSNNYFMKQDIMKDSLQRSMMQFIAEAKSIDGADMAIFELAEDIENCLLLKGEIYGRNTQDKINELGRQHGLLILANELSILYESPNEK